MTNYSCDRCGAPVKENDVHHLEIHKVRPYGFLHFCPQCFAGILEAIKPLPRQNPTQAQTIS